MEFDQSLDIRSESVLDRVVLYTATALFLLTIVLATAQVLIRFLNVQLFGLRYRTEPAARFILVVATYIGAAVASRNDEHIRIDYMLDKLEVRAPRLRRSLDLLVAGIIVGFVVIALVGTLGNAINHWGTSIGGIAVVTSGMIYLGISLGLAAMLLYEGSDLVVRFRMFMEDRKPRREREY